MILSSLSLFFLSLRDVFVSIQPFAAVLSGVLSLFISIISVYLFLRTRPKNVKAEMLCPGTVVINWSGHPLPENTPWLTPFQVWTPAESPHFNVQSWETIQISVQNILAKLPKDIEMRLLRGNPDVVLIIPQLAAGVSILLATLHGQTGVFPAITSPLRKDDGSFWLPEPISLSEIRLNARQQRSSE